ncbi:hypothetical protein V8D89_004010 [Ganoderma adspersum]
MSSSTVQKTCKLCKNKYTGKDSKHERVCRHYVWDLPHHFATKKGPMIRITRRADDHYIICKCVQSSGEKCDRTFASKSGLDKHLNNVKPVYWVAPNDVTTILAAQEQEQIHSPLVDPMVVDSEQPAGNSAEPMDTTHNTPPPLSARNASSPALSSQQALPSPGLSYATDPEDDLDVAPLNDQVRPAQAGPELYDVEAGTLTLWGLQINRRLKALICTSCHAVVLPSNVQIHMTYAHKTAGIHINKDRLEEIVVQEGLVRDWPVVPSGIPPSFAGLEETVQGYRCPLCSYMASKRKQINKHSTDKHKHSIQHVQLDQPWMQHYSQHPDAKTWFQVHPVNAATFVPPLQYLVDLREQLNEHPVLPTDQVDVRHVNPWLITTGWQGYANLYSSYVQPQLLELPKEDQDTEDFRWVKAFVFRYLEGPYDQLAQTPEICRQILNTDTLTGDLNHTPLHKHQDRTSFVNCQRVLAQLVIFLLRTSDSVSYPIPFSQHISTLLTALKRAFLEANPVLELADEEGGMGVIQNIFKALHALLFALWTQPWAPSPYEVDGEERENPVPDPTVRFLVCTQANRDGSIKDPQNVTGIIAKLVYCMRLTFLEESTDRRNAQPDTLTVTAAARGLRVWFTEGSESTFHTLRSLQHRASSIVIRVREAIKRERIEYEGLKLIRTA